MASIGGVPEFDAVWPSGGGGRRNMPTPLASALILVHVLFAVTIVGGLGLLLTASSYGVLDGGVLALIAYAAAPGTLGWWLARRSWEGGVRVWRGLVAVQVWLILASVSNIVQGSPRGFAQLLVPILILCFLTRPESRAWFRLRDQDRQERRPFSLSRMIRWRRDEGQTAVEYAGLIAVVAAIIVALLVSGLGTQIFTGIQSQVCKVTGAACPAPSGEGTDATAGKGDGDGPGSDGRGDANDGTGTGKNSGSGEDEGNAGDGDHGTDADNSDDPSASRDDPAGTGNNADYADETDDDKDVAAEGEPGWEDDEKAADDGDEKKGDDGCFSGFGAFFGCAGNQIKQVGQGLFVDGIWGDLTGMYNIVRHPMDTLKGLKDYGSSIADQWSQDAKDAGKKWSDGHYLDALTDWGGATVNSGVKILDDMFVGDEVRDQWNNGNKTRAVTTVLWNVGSLFIPGYGEAKIAEKIGKLGKLGKLGRLSKLAEKAGKAAEDAKKAAKAGDAEAAEKAAKDADDAADEAEKKAKESGCTISAPSRRLPYDGTPYDDTPPGGLTGSSGTGTTVLAAGSSPYVVLAEGGCDEDAKQQAGEARKQADEAAEAEKAAKKEASRKQVGKWKKPSWYKDLKNPRKGFKDGGDGAWKSKRSVAYWPNQERWMRYQEQVSKVKRGKEYSVKDPETGRDVDFDGWDSSRQTYVEAKFGYGAKVRPDGSLEPAQAQKFVKQAERQLRAAGNKPVEWHFSNQAAAEAAEEAFDAAGVDVVVKYTPWEK
ncbi:Tox-REase-5 domain-containing protein [Streptomyces sp. NBC_01613]|uniref:Tox-REase-5 domain-containing protein n=1 Tax=Streptomyces sp. NBC_01613 TaxID=2975896 RepID=UPI00386A44F6